MIKDYEKRIQFHEGYRDMCYLCTEGKKTIGFGHNIEARPFTLEETKALGDWKKGITKNAAAMLLRNDIEICLTDLKKLGFWYYLDDERQYALLDMCYQLGYKSLCNFKKMIEAIRTKDYSEAANQCLQSRYGIQTPVRAKRIAWLIKTGRWVEDKKEVEKLKI